MTRLYALLIGGLCCLSGLNAQQMKRELLPWGNFESWYTRIIKESNVLGGDSVHLYTVAPEGLSRVKGALPVETIWGSSNVYAEVFGVTKLNVNVCPKPHKEGLCASIRTVLMNVKVLGTIKVITAGALYTGRISEPVRSMDTSFAMIDMGIPFTEKPKSLVFDYMARMQNSGTLIQAKGGFKARKKPGIDKGEIIVLLQKRWEEDGKVYAKRIGTAEMMIGESTDWQENVHLDIVYGKLDDSYLQTEKGRLNNLFFTDNNEGERVEINEVEWGNADEKPTHLIVYMSSGSLGAYIGEPDNELCVDNVGFVY